jgi:alkylated DNA nucleotide flippase Atl1
VSQLQGRIERARRVGQQLQTSRQEILQQHRRLRAEQSILLRDARALAARRALPVCPGATRPV